MHFICFIHMLMIFPCVLFLSFFHSFSVIFLFHPCMYTHLYTHIRILLNISLCHARLIICHSRAPGNDLRLMKVFSQDKCFVFWKALFVRATVVLIWQTPQSFYHMTLLKTCTESLINLMTGGLNTGLFETFSSHIFLHTHTLSVAHSASRGREGLNDALEH